MWLGQFQFQSNPDANAHAGNDSIADPGCNAKPLTNAHTDARAVERHDYRKSAGSQRRSSAWLSDRFTGARSWRLRSC